MAVAPLVWLVLALLLAERGVELVVNRRNARWLNAHGARWLGEDGFGLILASQVALFALTIAEVLFAPWSGVGWWTWPFLAVALLAQGLRYWVIRTLGPRWSIRVATVPGAARVVGGPYRFLAHPNYLAVAVEAFAIPLALGAWGSALVVGAVCSVALARRIRLEEGALRASA